MTFTSIARVPTLHASRYLQQLCKHWSHNLRVEFTAERGTIVFPRDVRGADWPGDATLTFDAEPEVLVLTLYASADAQLQGLKAVVERHLNRFAFREAPFAYDWRDG